MLLMHLGLYWVILPMVAGVALAVVLLLGWNRVIRRLLTVRGSTPGGDVARVRRNLLGFALAKYPVVALLIWWLVRAWSNRELVAFVGGYLLLQAVIFLRTVGKILTEKP